MSKERVAIFVDWANVYPQIHSALSNIPGQTFDCNNIDHLTYLFCSFLVTNDEKLFRIYLYNAEALSPESVKSYVYNTAPQIFPAFKQWWQSPIASQSSLTPENRQRSTHSMSQKFHKAVMKHNLYALRLGQQRCRVDSQTGKVSFVQKQVDMLLGIDIAHVALRQQVEKVMVFSADTDVAPALKLARVNGIQTIASYIDRNFHPDIRIQKHCDFIRTLDIAGICQQGITDAWDFKKIYRWESDFGN